MTEPMPHEAAAHLISITLSAYLLDQLKVHKHAILEELAADVDALWWRISILEPGGRIIEVDAPSGWAIPDWQTYAAHYGPGCTATPIAGLAKPRGPVNLDEALAGACDGRGGHHAGAVPGPAEPRGRGRHRGRRHPAGDPQGMH